MIKIFKKFFRFSGEHRRAWYLSVVLEFLRCIAEAIQFFPLFLVLLHLVDGTMTPAVAWTALGLVALSVALQAVLHYFSHKLEMRACYLMLDDKRISIGERMKYMPMGYFNDRSLGNLTAICTSTMEDLESMAGAIVVRILAGVLHALVFSLGFMIIDWRIGLIFLAGVVAMLLVNSRMLAMSRKYSPERLAAQMRLVIRVRNRPRSGKRVRRSSSPSECASPMALMARSMACPRGQPVLRSRSSARERMWSDSSRRTRRR